MRTGTGKAARLERTRIRFDRWRRTCQDKSRIPDALWALAVKVAGQCGLSRTARELRLDYYALKKRLESTTGPWNRRTSRPVSGRATASANRRAAVATFVELPSSLSVSRECILELESPDGAKMRIHLKGTEPPDLTALSRSFWGVGV